MPIAKRKNKTARGIKILIGLKNKDIFKIKLIKAVKLLNGFKVDLPFFYDNQ